MAGRPVQHSIRASPDDAIRLFQLVIDNIPQFIFWKDKTSTYLGCNANFATVAGVASPESIVGKTDFDLAWTPEQAAFFRQVDREVMDSGTARFHIIEPQKQADGKDAWLDTNKIPLFDDAGVVVGILGTYEDITKRIEAERALREREANLHVTLNAIAEGVVATDARGRIRRINPVAERILGRQRAEVLGAAIDDVYVTRIDRTARGQHKGGDGSRSLFTEIRREGAVRTQQVILDDAHGKPLYRLHESAAPILDERGEFSGVVLIVRDVTAQHELESRLRHAQKMDSIGQLAGGVAHDFNNMLTGILGGAELLKKHVAHTQEGQDLLAMMTHAARRASELTSKLLTFSRRGSLQQTTVDLHVCIRDAVQILSRSVDRRIEIECTLHADTAFVVGDPGELESCMLNLGINARDAMPAGGHITFSTRARQLDEAFCAQSPFDLQPGAFVEVEVRDDGEGIAPENLARVFEPFFTTKPLGGGTGLGLAAVYGAVTAHRGAILLTSTPGAGTTFTLLFPRVTGAFATALAAPRDEHAKTPHQGTVLLVDDEAILRATGRGLLEELGYDVIEASNGVEAVDRFVARRDDIDLVLLDVMMPIMDGATCFLRLRLIDPSLKVVLVSGYSEEGAIVESMRRGAAGYVKKPYTRADLAAALATVRASK